ncbi:hypothetical protein ACJBU6_05439 [Exserohilum turcicum]
MLYRSRQSARPFDPLQRLLTPSQTLHDRLAVLARQIPPPSGEAARKQRVPRTASAVLGVTRSESTPPVPPAFLHGSDTLPLVRYIRLPRTRRIKTRLQREP